MFISDTLLNKLKMRIKQPEGSFEPEDLLDFIYLALTAELVPELIKAREEFYVKNTTMTVQQGGSLRLPPRAFGGIIREIKLIKNGRYLDLIRIREEDYEDPTTTGQPNTFTVRGNRIIFSPIPDQAYDFHVTYWLAPPRIVLSTECARVTGVNGTTISCTPPSSWNSSNTFDVVKGTSDYEPVVLDATVTAVNPGSIEFSTAPDIEVGDYICLAGESPYAYLQSAYYPVLLQYAVSLIHEANGDSEQKQLSDAKAEAMLARLQGVITERIQGSPVKITSSLV
jgi:hypothetical protein